MSGVLAAIDAALEILRDDGEHHSIHPDMNVELLDLQDARQYVEWLADALELALPYVTDCEGSPDFKPGVVAKHVRQIRLALDRYHGTEQPSGVFAPLLNAMLPTERLPDHLPADMPVPKPIGEES